MYYRNWQASLTLWRLCVKRVHCSPESICCLSLFVVTTIQETATCFSEYCIASPLSSAFAHFHSLLSLQIQESVTGRKAMSKNTQTNHQQTVQKPTPHEPPLSFILGCQTYCTCISKFSLNLALDLSQSKLPSGQKETT